MTQSPQNCISWCPKYLFPISDQCPSVPPFPEQLCVAPPGTQDCHYDQLKEVCCCGRCHTDFTCAQDSITGSGLWQLMDSSFCPDEGCDTQGEFESVEFFESCQLLAGD